MQWLTAPVRQFIKFGIVGVGNTLIDFSIYTIATRFFQVHFLAANATSWFAAVCFSFTMNKFWTFRSSRLDLWGTQYVKFFVVSLISLGLSTLLLYLLVAVANVHDLIAKMLTIGIVVFWNFFMNKFWTFNHA